MCGINGIIQFKNQHDSHWMASIVHLMNERIIHRGPDHEGMYSDERCALGMRRLSIIDLAGGEQPIWNEDHSMMIVFNGEIYNYLELRESLLKQGHTFSTLSDTEVVLHGYESYGTAFLEQMEGMFAFTIYDIRAGKWIIARDRIGEKPLYYYKDDNFFIFGSELKSLLSTGLIPKDIDKDALSQYFQLTYIPSPKSIIQNVYKLPQASVISLEADGAYNINTYWKLSGNVAEGLIWDYDTCKKQLRDALFHSVEQRMRSDVPFGAFLSGGFDSTIIVGIMSKLSSEKINTFTIGFDDKQYDESKLAELVAKKHNTNHHLLKLDWNEVLNDLETLTGNIDEPFADSSLIATYAVSKLARKHVKVVLTGDGGDELFGGYNKYLITYYASKYNAIPNIIKRGVINPLVRILPPDGRLERQLSKIIQAAGMKDSEQHKLIMCLAFKKNELEQLMPGYGVSSMGYITSYYNELIGADAKARALYADLKVSLEGDMLTKVDRASMLASLETRVPLLDSKVVELTYKIPSKYKIDNGGKKIILKDTFRDLIPKALFKVPKHGFSVPIGKWLNTSLRNQLLAYANPSFLMEQGIFNASYINGIIQSHYEHCQGRYSNMIWAFYVFQNWYSRVMQ